MWEGARCCQGVRGEWEEWIKTWLHNISSVEEDSQDDTKYTWWLIQYKSASTYCTPTTCHTLVKSVSADRSLCSHGAACKGADNCTYWKTAVRGDTRERGRTNRCLRWEIGLKFIIASEMVINKEDQGLDKRPHEKACACVIGCAGLTGFGGLSRHEHAQWHVISGSQKVCSVGADD